MNLPLSVINDQTIHCGSKYVTCSKVSFEVLRRVNNQDLYIQNFFKHFAANVKNFHIFKDGFQNAPVSSHLVFHSHVVFILSSTEPLFCPLFAFGS